MSQLDISKLRRDLFAGRMTQGQVDGINAILAAFEVYHIADIRWQAYCLATAYHETARTMQPISERGGAEYVKRMYDPTSSDPHRANMAKINGNSHAGDGWKYRGRGYVQLTWHNNYETMGIILKHDLVENPDLAMRPDIAAAILCVGMARGIFTGKKLATYFNDDTTDHVGARRIINGQDKAMDIAKYSRSFLAALGGE